MDDYSSPAPTLEVPYDTLVGEEKTVDNVEMKKEKQKAVLRRRLYKNR